MEEIDIPKMIRREITHLASVLKVVLVKKHMMSVLAGQLKEITNKKLIKDHWDNYDRVKDDERKQHN